MEEAIRDKMEGRKRKRSRSKGKQAERWDQMFDRLVEFKRIHGHCLVPNRYVHDPSLGAWVSTQRRHYKALTSAETGVACPMTPERAGRLASLGFAWATSDPRHVPWETRFQQLLEYKARHGTLPLPKAICFAVLTAILILDICLFFRKRRLRGSNWVEGKSLLYPLFDGCIVPCRLRLTFLFCRCFFWSALLSGEPETLKLVRYNQRLSFPFSCCLNTPSHCIVVFSHRVSVCIACNNISIQFVSLCE